MNSEKAALYIPVIFLITLLFVFPARVFADETTSGKKWAPRFTFEYRPDRSRSLARFDALIPLWQKHNALFFSDLRYIDTSGPGMEGNLGLGYRKLQHDLLIFGGDWIWGGYAFFDRRKTALGNYFSQLTFGAELLTPDWSFRGNGYLPDTTGDVLGIRSGPGGGGTTLFGTTVVSSTGTTTIVDKEWALPGFDLEAGVRFKTLPDHALWLYAGYFHFDRSETRKIAGPRVRAEYRMYDLFDWMGSEITLGAEIRKDSIGGTDGLVLARLSIPIGKVDAPARGFEKRMMEFIQRDVDVVTLVNTDETGSAGAAGAAAFIVDPQSRETLNVYVVNNDGTGDCTQANPCTLADVASDNNYGSGDVIVLVDNSGNVVGNIDLTATVGALGSDRRQVVGGEGDIILTLSSGDTINLNGLGARPTLEGNLTLANESQIRGFDIVSPGTAISGTDVNRPVIRDINVINAGNNALDLEGMIQSADISDFSIQQVGGTAIDLSGTSGSLDFNNIDIAGLGSGTGLSLNGASGNVEIDGLNISGTGAEGSTGVDMRGSTGALTVTNPGTIQNVVTGFDFDANSNATLNFQNGIINAGVPVNTVGVINGDYNFTGSTITKDNTLSTQTGFGGQFFFIDATGGGVGTANDRASVDFAEANTSPNDVIFLVEDGTGFLMATDGFQLQNNQRAIGFARGDTEVDFTESNEQFRGTFRYGVADPTGLGAATLSNNGGTEALTLANNNEVRDFNIVTNIPSDAIGGNGFNGAVISNINTSGGENSLNFINASGPIIITDSRFADSAGSGLRVEGGDANIALSNTEFVNTGGSVFEFIGGMSNMTFNGDINQGNNASLIAVTAGHSGMLSFQNGNINATNGNGLQFDDADGTYNFTSPITLNGGDAGIDILNGSDSTFNFGNVTVNDSGLMGPAINLSGATNGVNFGDVDLTNLGGGTGLSLNGSSANVTMNTLDVTGTGAAGSTGVDMRGATGILNVTNAGTIQNVVTGFDFGANSNATLNFQNGLINAGIPVNTVGVTNGTYDFTGTTFIKDNNLSLETGFGSRMYFVDATGDGPGTPDNPTSADFVETNAAEGDIIFLVEEGETGNIIATDGLQLRNQQQLLGFGTGDAILDFTGLNPQFLGQFAYTISDPTGNGAATLSNNGGSAALMLASDVQVRDFSISTLGESDGIFGENFINANIQNIDVMGAGSHAIKLIGASGTVDISDSRFVDAVGEGFEIIGGDAEISVRNSVISSSQTDELIDIADTSGGFIRFDAATIISTSNTRGIRFINIGGDLEFNGPVDIQVSSGNGVTATGLGTSTVSFNDRLDIITESGSGLVVSGGILNIAGGSIGATGGTGITASNTTVDIVLDSLSATAGTDGLNLTNVTGTITILDRTP